jgi:DNA-binding IclR family transcriptional regulator
MKKKIKESERYIESVLRALEVLDCFENHSDLSLKQLHEITGMNKSRIIRLCGTLNKSGYLKYDSETQQYSLGFRFLVLGNAYEQRNTLISVSRPVLKKLAKNTAESASLFVIDDIFRTCIAREEGSRSLRLSLSEGQRFEIYSGASGKVLLAFGPEELKRRIIRKNKLKKLTAHTITEPKQILSELDTIRMQGYAFSAGERDPDVGALSAPIYNHEKKVCAALSLAGPISRFLPENHAEYLKSLLEASQYISKQLGFQPSRHRTRVDQNNNEALAKKG